MSTDDNTERFSQTRKAAAMAYNTQSEWLYQDHWDITLGDIHSIETIHDDGISDPYNLRPVIQQLDYSGIDALVNVNSGLIGIAQRLRPDAREQVDFSLRCDTGTPYQSEYEKFTTDTKSITPQVYGFGVYDESKSVLTAFHLIDIPLLSTHLQNRTIRVEGPYPSPGNTKAMYISIEELGLNGCLIESWDSDEIETILTKEE